MNTINVDSKQREVQGSAASNNSGQGENEDVMARILGASRGICGWPTSSTA